MRIDIFSQDDKLYKANLHCHSTNSDGKLSPKELKELYKSAGYSVLAYSDHNVLIDHSELSDDDFLAMTAVEIDVMKQGDSAAAFRPCYHICFYHEDPHRVAIPCFNPKYVWGKRQDLRDAQPYVGTPDYVRDYDGINDMINRFAEEGFIAMLNHPTWSQQTADEYKNLDTTNIFAMEMYNHECNLLGYEEDNSHLYDIMLRRGHRLYCTATDDNHNSRLAVAPAWGSLGGFVMIKAPELSQKAIYGALKEGHFYASTGPEIKEMYIEDDILHVKTSPAVKIAVNAAGRKALVSYPTEAGAMLCEATFDLSKLCPGYARVIVYDENGRKAWSQPIRGEFSGEY